MEQSTCVLRKTFEFATLLARGTVREFAARNSGTDTAAVSQRNRAPTLNTPARSKSQRAGYPPLSPSPTRGVTIAEGPASGSPNMHDCISACTGGSHIFQCYLEFSKLTAEFFRSLASAAAVQAAETAATAEAAKSQHQSSHNLVPSSAYLAHDERRASRTHGALS